MTSVEGTNDVDQKEKIPAIRDIRPSCPPRSKNKSVNAWTRPEHASENKQ